MNILRSRYWVIALGNLLLAACGAASSDAKQEPFNCEEHTAASLEGEWRLTATGERYDCGAARDDGDIEIEVKPFSVYAELQPTVGESVIDNGDEADAFVERVMSANIKLVTDEISNLVTFEGEGGTDCEVSFSITEQLPNRDELVYNFEGWVRELDQATGSFTGTGPGACKVRGSFTLDRR